MAKKRLDELLVDRELVESLAEARARIMAGEVIVGEHRVDKAGTRFDPQIAIRVRGRKTHRFVSRGGLKLERALEFFQVDVTNRVGLDLGASTGGFTDCLIQEGAARVYAVDVGYGLLDWSLRQHERVVNLERTHAGKLTSAEVPEPIEILVADISFNTLTRLLPPVLPLLAESAIALLLIKPQFEAERHEVGEGGIVRDPKVHERVCARLAAAVGELGGDVLGIERSPILGGHGNVEFLLGARFGGDG